MKNIVYAISIFFLLFLSPVTLIAQTLVNLIGVDTVSTHAVTGNQFFSASTDSATSAFIIGNEYLNNGQHQCMVLNLRFSGGLAWETPVTAAPTLQTYGAAICVKNGTVYATGFTWDSTNQKSAIFTMALDTASGDTIWTRSYSGSYSGYDAGTAITADDSGNVYVAGTDQTDTVEARMILLKYDASGNLLWVNGYDTTGLYTGAAAIVLNPDSNVVVTGFSGTSYGSWDFATAWFSLGGAQLSVARSTNGNGSFSKPVGVYRDAANNIIVIGTAATTPGNTNIKIIGYNSSFAQQWVKTWGDSSSQISASGVALVFSGAGPAYISGTASNSSGGTDMLALNMNLGFPFFDFAHDTVIWAKRFSATNAAWQASAAAVSYDNNSNLILVGKIYDGNKFNMTTTVIDPNSNLVWVEKYNAGGTYDGATAVMANGNSVYTFGESVAGSDTVFNMVQYQTLSLNTQIVSDTSGNPLYVQGNVIIRFDPSVLNLDVVNSTGKIFGTPEEILTTGFDATFESELGDMGIDGKSCYLQKLAPNYHTWDRTLISKTGDTVKIAPFWSSFLLIYGGGADEGTVRDGLHTLYPSIKYDHLNYVGVAACNCSTLCADDSLYSDQYALHDDSAGHYKNGNINAEGAWAIETGKPFVKLGIFDTGIDWAHQDFKGVNGVSKIIGGYDYVIYNTQVLNIPGEEADFYGHGTGVAATAGALRNNNIGIAGVAGGNFCGIDTNTGVSLYSYGTEGPYGSGGQALVIVSAVISAMADALSDNSAINYSSMDIMNFSLEIPAGSGASNMPDCTEKFYYASRLGKIVVASSGDVGNENPLAAIYPAAYDDDWLICVGGSDENGDYYSGSLSQTNMDVMAPYLSTMDYSANMDSTSYKRWSGTSFSAPMVAGLAGLLLSHLNNPNGQPDAQNLAPEDVEQIAQRTAYFDTAGQTNYTVYQTGWGRIDLSAAMQMADTTHARLLHFDSRTSSSGYNLTKISTSDIGLTFLADVPGDTSMHISAGGYLAEVWQFSDTIYHHITLKPKETIRAAWARTSSSQTYAHYDSVTFDHGDSYVYNLQPFEKAYMDSSVIPDTSSANMWGYFYLLKDSLNPSDTIAWVPFDPTDTTKRIKMAYTVYLDTVTLPVIPTVINAIKPTGGFSLTEFPNPAGGSIHIVLTCGSQENYTVNLIDLLGKQVETLFKGTTAYLAQDYNISNLEAGMYFIQASSVNKVETIKLSVIK